MIVRDAVRRRAVTVEPATTVTAAAETMDREAVGTLLLTDAGQLVGCGR